MDRLKQTSKQSDLIFRLFLYIPVVWAALLIAQSMGGGLPELLSKLTAALEHPFQIQWTDKSLLSILICTGAYIMGLCLYDAEGRRTRDGEEHGSAMWGSPKQVNAQFCQKQNKILTRHVRLGLDTHMPEHGAPKTMTYLPENEPELMIILKRERLKRSYHATAGNLEEYLDKLEKTTLREKLKRAKTAVSTQEVSSHKRGLER